MLQDMVCSVICFASTYPSPGPCTGDCWTHDPGFYQRNSDGRYFRFASGDGIHIHEASSLIGPWKATGVALANGSVIDHPGRTKLWAPDVHYEPETKKYIMYYAVSTRGSHDSVIGVASSPDMTPGTWTDHGSILHSTSKSRYNAIDANWISDKGKQYLNFGSYWDGLFQVPLDNMVKVKHDSETTASNLAYNSTANHHIEASFIFQYQDWYYLLFSSGRAAGYEKELPEQGEEYRIVMCRSKSSQGGFVDEDGKSCLKSGGMTLLASHENIYGPGGQGVFEDKQYGHVLYYHYADKSIGLSQSQYQFGWNRLGWKEGWPVLL
ncbi:glycosyl hydrolase [Aspergillus cavernicola]|uniref:Arabinan endo-1,5-alpha-L-arabinosidase n=1 Tax=Aspergillus cavernicola TaxID=176166 RepID=A0ABR4IWX6_9EURO